MGMAVRFGRVAVLSNIDFAVAAGDVVSISGANGAGKTTLLRAVAGVFQPGTGRRVGPPSCAYVPSVVKHTPITAEKWLTGMPRSRRVDPHEMLDAMGFDGDLGNDCRALSFGNSRKLLLAEALSSTEQLIVIDEVSAGLDQQGLAGLTGIIRNSATAGTAFVLADQQSRPVPSATVSYTVANGMLRARPPGEHVSVEFSGPAENLEGLIANAGELGFNLDRNPA